MGASTNYLIYSINNKLSLTHNSIKTTQCRFQNRLRLNTYKHIEDNTFIRDLGDSIALMKCRQLIVPLATNSTICFQDIKLANNLGFIDRETHILKRNSSIRACNLQFPENLIKTTDNFFIAFKPTGQVISVKNYISL